MTKSVSSSLGLANTFVTQLFQRKMSASRPASDETMREFDMVISNSGIIELFVMALSEKNVSFKATRVTLNLQRSIEDLPESPQKLLRRVPELESFFVLLDKMRAGTFQDDLGDSMDLITVLSETFPSLIPLKKNFEQHNREKAEIARNDSIKKYINDQFAEFVIALLEGKASQTQAKLLMDQLAENSHGKLHEPMIREVMELLALAKEGQVDNIDLEIWKLPERIKPLLNNSVGIDIALKNYRDVEILKQDIANYHIFDNIIAFFQGCLTSKDLISRLLICYRGLHTYGCVPVVRRFAVFIDLVLKYPLCPRDIAVNCQRADITNLFEGSGMTLKTAIDYATNHAAIYHSGSAWLESGDSLSNVFSGYFSSSDIRVTDIENNDYNGLLKNALNLPGGPIDLLLLALNGKVTDWLVADLSHSWYHILNSKEHHYLRHSNELIALLDVLCNLHDGVPIRHCVQQHFSELCLVVEETDRFIRALTNHLEVIRVTEVVRKTVLASNGPLIFMEKIINGEIETRDICTEGSRILAKFAEDIHDGTAMTIEEVSDKVDGFWHLFAFLEGLNQLSREEILMQIRSVLPELNKSVPTVELTRLMDSQTPTHGVTLSEQAYQYIDIQ